MLGGLTLFLARLFPFTAAKCAFVDPLRGHISFQFRARDMQFEFENSAVHKVTSTFDEAKKNAGSLLAAYETAGISLNDVSPLAKLIRDSLAIANDYLAGHVFDDRSTDVALIRGQLLNKIAMLVSRMPDQVELAQYLRRLKKGTVEPLERSRSEAKDALWELEVWGDLVDAGFDVEFREPDIVLQIPTGPLAIACKRIYSAANAISSMSGGVKQIARSGLPGILAVNIDDLVIPEGKWMIAPTNSDAREELRYLAARFLADFQGKLETYISTGRILAVMVSVGSAVFVEDEGIGDCRHGELWAHPNLSADKKAHLLSFQSLLIGRP